MNKKGNNKTINALQNEKEQLGIKEVVSHLDNKDLEKQLVSKDNTTILTQISIDKNMVKYQKFQIIFMKSANERGKNVFNRK